MTNEALKDRFRDDKSVIFIEPSKYIRGEDDYIDHINHYSKRVMFNLASELSGTLNNLGVSARTRSLVEVIANKILKKVRSNCKKVRSNLPWFKTSWLTNSQERGSQGLTRSQISARQTSLCPAPSRRMLLLQTQAVPPRRHPLRKNRAKSPSRRHSRLHRPMDEVSVHAT